MAHFMAIVQFSLGWVESFYMQQKIILYNRVFVQIAHGNKNECFKRLYFMWTISRIEKVLLNCYKVGTILIYFNIDFSKRHFAKEMDWNQLGLRLCGTYYSSIVNVMIISPFFQVSLGINTSFKNGIVYTSSQCWRFMRISGAHNSV